MTDKVNEKTNELGNSAQGQSDNPLEELAKIIGYQDDSQSNSEGDGSANEAVTDLEAELLREFGVESQVAPDTPAPVVAAPAADPIAPTPQVETPNFTSEPTSSAAPISDAGVDDVLDDMSRYALPTHSEAVGGVPKVEIPPVPADPTPAVEAPVVSPVNEPADNVFEAPTMSRATPVLPQEPVEVPQVVETPEQIIATQPEAEVAELPNPLSTSSPFTSENGAAPEENLNTPEFDLGEMSNNLEQELEKLQQGLEAGVHEVPADVVPPQAPVNPFAEQANLPAENYIEPAPEYAAPETVEPSVAVVTDEVAERPFPSVVLPQDGSVPPNFADLVAADEPVERTEELESVLDVSGFTETEADIEVTAPFEIPELPQVEEFSREQSNIDVDLDLELEREFSQLISGDLPSEQEVRVSAEPVVAAAASHAPATPVSSGSGSENADMDELNELFNVGVAEPGIDKAPVVNNGPDRIDVTHDADNPDQDVAVDEDGEGTSSNTLAVVGVLAALLVGGGAYLYFQNSGTSLGGSNEPVIIKADNSPIKEVPADPGGASVPNQDQAVYEQVEGNDVSVANQSTLVKSTEEPVDIVQKTLNPSILPLEGRDLAGDDKNADRLTPNDGSATAQTDDASQPLVTPRRVQTVIVQSDGTIITREAPAPVAENNTATAPTPTATETPVSAAPSQPVETALATPAPTQEVAPAAPVAQPEPTVPLSNDTAAAIANAPVQPAQPASNYSGYYMQIASQPSLTAAQSSYDSLASRFNSILGGLPVEYQTANIEGKGTFHRVRIQAGSRAEANSLCSRYKSAGGSCFVAR